MTLGGGLFIFGVMLPRICSPHTPEGILITSAIFLICSIPIFIIGCCIYARGIGYPFWLGIFGITMVGLLILLLLPDRFPEPDDYL